MAFTTAQKQDIVYYLGWPGKVLIESSTHYNSVVASRLTNLIPEIESQANTLVDRVKEIDKVLRQSIHRASTIRMQDIELNPEERSNLRRERRKILHELSDLLDIKVNKTSGGIAVIA